MKTQLLELQKQLDSLRSDLKILIKQDDLGVEFESKEKSLRDLEGLFHRLCSKHQIQLSKFGRII